MDLRELVGCAVPARLNPGFSVFQTSQNRVSAFLSTIPPAQHPQVMALGVAGPVVKADGGETCEITNLPYRIDGRDIASRFGFRSVRLLNDFYAVAAAISVIARGGRFPGLSRF